MEEYHLKGKRMSGRAVHVEAMGPSDVENNLTAAAKLVGKEAPILELKKTEWRNGVKLFVRSFSDPCEDPRALEPKQWKKVTPGMLDDMGAYFTSKDIQVLEALFRDYHEVNPDELEAIVGKAVPVASGG